MNTTQTARLNQLMSKATKTAKEQEELDKLLALAEQESNADSNDTDTVDDNRITGVLLTGYGYFNGMTYGKIDDETVATISFDIVDDRKVKHNVSMTVSEIGSSFKRVENIAPGSAVYATFEKKHAGQSYTDKDGATHAYRKDGYRLIRLSLSNKAIVDSLMFDKNQSKLDLLKQLGASREEMLSAILNG